MQRYNLEVQDQVPSLTKRRPILNKGLFQMRAYFQPTICLKAPRQYFKALWYIDTSYQQELKYFIYIPLYCTKRQNCHSEALDCFQDFTKNQDFFHQKNSKSV